MTIHLILGGAKSGKTSEALRTVSQLADMKSLPKLYVATAQSFDNEMSDKIIAHKNERDSTWNTIECPTEISTVINESSNTIILIDCLTLWLSNIMLKEKNIIKYIDDLIKSISDSSNEIIIVSNEVGLSIIPNTPLGRKFQNQQGILNQQIAKIASNVILVTAGISQKIKG